MISLKVQNEVGRLSKMVKNRLAMQLLIVISLVCAGAYELMDMYVYHSIFNRTIQIGFYMIIGILLGLHILYPRIYPKTIAKFAFKGCGTLFLVLILLMWCYLPAYTYDSAGLALKNALHEKFPGKSMELQKERDQLYHLLSDNQNILVRQDYRIFITVDGELKQYRFNPKTAQYWELY